MGPEPGAATTGPRVRAYFTVLLLVPFRLVRGGRWVRHRVRAERSPQRSTRAPVLAIAAQLPQRHLDHVGWRRMGPDGCACDAFRLGRRRHLVQDFAEGRERSCDLCDRSTRHVGHDPCEFSSHKARARCSFFEYYSCYEPSKNSQCPAVGI
ncbi:hypothetical protein NDU88_006668 [Pleurodeles waltl]|uniref:Secreted protein n=1 Tax=Pleurodeles waltl TaxID=8319 RepID=A0AAV7LXJ4_PLEWA|nr:hypothetical protein NDU88_006668 [Pleurodeles waltl]